MKKVLKYIGIGLLSLMLIGFAMKGCEGGMDAQTDIISNSLADDEIEAYNMTYKNKDWLNAQAHANLAAQFFIQAGDEKNYKIWHDKAKEAEALYMKQMGF